MTATSILFEKYQVTDIIYESDTVTVYLAEHIYMKAKRVIKKILRKSICQNSFFSEINVLKSIRHPHIPIIYDVEEDNRAYYIIEEYMEGQNLDTYVRERGIMCQQDVIDTGIKICRIVEFLHCQKPIPVLFLDIHPKNILINNNEIFLVDFGSSYYLSETEKRTLLLGAVGYAAPEQYSYGTLDERADIYGIGAVLYFLMTGRSCDKDGTNSLQFPNNISEKLKMIVMQCLAYDRSDRFRSVVALLGNLTELQNNGNEHIVNDKPLIISFAGTDRRTGVTHISLMFAKYLSYAGYRVLYEEHNDSNHLRQLAKQYKLGYERGFFVWDSLLLKPYYGPQVQLHAQCDIIIRDGGVYRECVVDGTGVCVMVAGAKPWELQNSVTVCDKALRHGNKDKPMHIICNAWSMSWACELWKAIGYTGLAVPCMEDVTQRKDEEVRFFEELMSILGIRRKGGVTDKKKTRTFGRAAGEKADNHNNRRIGCSWRRRRHDPGSDPC